MFWKPILSIILVFSLFSCVSGNKTEPANDDEESQQRVKELPQVTVQTVQRGVFMRELSSNGQTSGKFIFILFCIRTRQMKTLADTSAQS